MVSLKLMLKIVMHKKYSSFLASLNKNISAEVFQSISFNSFPHFNYQEVNTFAVNKIGRQHIAKRHS